MPKRLLIYLFLSIIVCSADAQKLSGWGIEVKSFIFTDTYGPGDREWPSLFNNGYYPLPYGSNLEFASRSKGGSFPVFKNGWSIRADLVKRLFPVSGTKNNRVDLALGIGYRRYISKDESSPITYYRDTTQVYQLNSLKRTYTQRYADIQTRAIYKLMEEDSKIGIYFGFALQLSLALDGRIQEDFKVNEASWNTAGSSWVETGKADMHQDVPAKKLSYFSWGIPVGLFIKVTDHLFLVPEISYWHNWNRKYVYPDNYGGHKRSFSESGYLTIGARYNF